MARRVLRTDHDALNPDNDLQVEYEYDSKHFDVRGPDRTNHTSSDSLESRFIYDGLDRIVSEYNRPADADTFRAVYLFDDNSYRLFGADTFSFTSTGSLCYGRRFFEPGKSVSVDVLNKTNSNRITTLYDLTDRTIRYSGLSGLSYDSPGRMYYGTDFNNSSRRITRVYADSTGNNNTMRFVYDPNVHSMSCESVSSYTYSTSNLSCRSGLTSTRYSRLYSHTSATKSMLCEYILGMNTMSCFSYDSTAKTSTSNMRCTSSFDNVARRYVQTYDDLNDAFPALRCTFDATNNARSCDNLNFNSSRSTANLLCESDASGNNGQVVVRTVIDGNGVLGNGIVMVHDPNARQIRIEGVGGTNANLHVNGTLSQLNGTFKIDHPI